MPTTPLLPLPEGLEIITISATEQEVHIRVVSNRLSCACPRCSKPSCAIHSYYRRKKFFCREKECSQKIFAERLPAFLEPSSRLTARLRTIVQAIVGAFNAKAGARLGAQLGIQLSRTTFLHSLQRIQIPPVGQVVHVGIDDFGATRSYMSSCKDSRKEDLTWSSASSAEPSLNQVRLGQCSRVLLDGNEPVREHCDC